LFQAFDLHGGVKQKGDVARERSVDAVANCGVEGETVALFFGSGGKNEHVKMEEEPPKGGGIIKGWAGGGSDDNGA
jgi:hypothetical protein